MLEREIERRKRRASSLGVDALVSSLYFDHGLRYYVSWSRNPEYVVPGIVDAAQPSGDRVEFTLGGHRYSFRVTSKQYECDAREYEELELRRDGDLVFGQMLKVDRAYNCDMHIPRSVNAFVEGPWIDELRSLQRTFRQLEEARRAREHEEQVKKEATRFGLSDTTPPATGAPGLLALIKRLLRG